MDTIDNAIFSVTILPVSNEQILGGSVLPDRFVSGSKAQQTAIVGADLGSTVRLGRKISDVIVPATVA